MNEKQRLVSSEEFKNFKEVINNLRKTNADLAQQNDQKAHKIDELDEQLNAILG